MYNDVLISFCKCQVAVVTNQNICGKFGCVITNVFNLFQQTRSLCYSKFTQLIMQRPMYADSHDMSTNHISILLAKP